MAKEMNLMKKMEFDNILEFTVDLYKKNFFYYMKILSYYMVPILIITLLIQKLYLNTMINVLANSANWEHNSSFLINFYLKLLEAGLVLGSLYIFFYILSKIAIVKAVSDTIMGTQSSALNIFVITLKKFFPVLFVLIIYSLMLIIGACLCLIPALILVIYLAFIIQIVVLENKNFFSAIGRSFVLVNKNFWPIVLILIVYIFFTFFINFIIGLVSISSFYVDFFKQIIVNKGQSDPMFMVTYFQKHQLMYMIQAVISSIVTILIMPILPIALTLKFYNIKNFKEGTALLEDIRKEKNDTKK